MFNWLTQFKDASSETKWFVFQWFLYGALIVITTIYCYARLDFVRSYNTETSHSQPTTK